MSLLAIILAAPVVGQNEVPSAAEPAGEQDPAQQSPESAAPEPGAAPTTPASVATQTGLPVDLLIDADRLSEERTRLEALKLYLANTAPPGGIGGFFSGVGDWISRKLSGVRDPRRLGLGTIVENATELNGVLVAVEGLYRSGPTNDALTYGADELPLGELSETVVDGFGSDGPDGLPAAITGTVLVQQEGPVLHMNEVKPAPVLTLVRLGRVYELHANAADYQRAVEVYGQAAAQAAKLRDPGASLWGGFAMSHGGYIAEEELRDRKKAVSLYLQAWQLEGQLKSNKAPISTPPRTWVQDSNGAWSETTLREAVGERLDGLNSGGFWYKFVHTFVVISGSNAGIGLILMAIITRLLLYPLTRKQIQSSRAMQRLQPEIKGLQEKHGKDKQKFQEDFWKLCRSRGVNPFGGCLPLVVQLPLLWMVYRGIRAYTVQLADHSFLWIPNLADPDLPLLVLYTISMIAFQKLTMKNQPVADPQQQQQQNMMVWMMPIMFFMFFQSIASGFILYWLGTNLIYLPQQYFGTRASRKDQSQDEQPKEHVTTIEPGQTAKGKVRDGGDTAEGSPSWVDQVFRRLKGLITGKDEDGSQPAVRSYEDRKRDEKKAARGSPRRRKR